MEGFGTYLDNIDYDYSQILDQKKNQPNKVLTVKDRRII